MGWLLLRIAGLVLVAMFALSCSSGGNKSDDTKPDLLVEMPENQDSLIIEHLAVDSVNVMELLQASHEIEYRSSVVGSFVTAIDSVSSGNDLFWLYSVNGVMGQVACDRFRAGAGDTVRWHFRRVGQ